MKKKKIVFVSLLLIFTVLITYFPVYAQTETLAESPESDTYEEQSEISEIDQAAVEAEMKQKVGMGIVEIESLREESSKHFQLEDGSYQAIAYLGAVHRKDKDGKWIDIDNRLSTDKNDENKYNTPDGRFSFAKDFSSNNICSINDGDYKISFGLISDGLKCSEALISNHKDRLSEAENLKGEEKLQTLKSVNIETKIRYDNVFDGIDIEYLISGNDVKENIIINKQTDIDTFKYDLNLKGLKAELSNNMILLVNDSYETVYTLPMPVLYDANGEQICVTSCLLNGESGSCKLEVSFDSSCQNDEHNAYPLIITRALIKKSYINNDTYIDFYNQSYNYGDETHLWISSIRMTYIRKNMPTLPTYAEISSGKLFMSYYYNVTSGSLNIGLYRCLRNWNQNTLNWSVANGWTNMGLSTTRSALSTAYAGSGINSTTPGTIYFNITSLVESWYAGSTNYGVGLKYENGPNLSVILCGSGYSIDTEAYFQIQYINNDSLAIDNGVYFVKNRQTNKYIYSENIQFNNNNNVVQYELTCEGSERWRIVYTHYNNYYVIMSSYSSTDVYLRVKGDSNFYNKDIVVHNCLDENNTRTITDGMLWEITNTSNGAVKVQAAVGIANNLTLCTLNSSTDNGVKIKQRYYGNDNNYEDEWFLFKTTIQCWYSDGNIVAYWENNPNYCNINLDESSTPFYFSDGISSAVYQWRNALNIGLTQSTESNANLICIGATKDYILSHYHEYIAPNVLGVTKSDLYPESEEITYWGDQQKTIYKYRSARIYIPSVGLIQDMQIEVIVHEYGHALGYLDHSNNGTDVMAPNAHISYQLKNADKKHLQQFYN